MSLRIPLALLVALVLAVTGCGGEDEPARPKAKGSADQAFVNRFAAHNDTSRRLAAEGRKRAKAAAVKKLAAALVEQRESEQEVLRGLQQRLGGSAPGGDPLGVTPEQAAESVRPEVLRGAEPFDRTFLELMVRHHQGALSLVQAERAKGKDGALKAFADQLGVKRADELNRLTELLAEQR